MRVLVAEDRTKVAAHLRLIATVTLLAAVIFSAPWRWLATAENLTIDLRYQARGPAVTEPASVIVGVADSSFTIAGRAPVVARDEAVIAAMAAPWPWDRRVFAGLVRRLRASGARAIVFDVVFAAENSGDTELAQVLAEPGAPVVLACLYQQAHSAAGEGTVTLLEPRPEFLVSSGGRTGYANVWPDDDGILRRLTTTLRPAELLGPDVPAAHEAPVRSLAFAAAQAVSSAGARRDAAGYIRYLGPPGTVPTVPIEDVFLPDRWNGPRLGSGKFFRDRVVWIGALSEIQFKDYYATPLGRMPGVEAQASAFETLVTGRPLRALPRGAVIALVGAFAVVAAFVTMACRRMALQLALVAAGAIGWAALALALFARADIVLPVVAPVGAGLLSASGGLAAGFISEQRERRRLRGVLSRYVSEEVAQVILRQPDEFGASLRGQRRPVAVLFADLRGFTGWVERAEPEALVAQLNEYFHGVVDCVLAQRGTLQKFIGDAVLAVWGDTGSAGPAADAARAVDAALAMQTAVARLNAGWAGRRDRVPVAIGIGLHHGVAMVGNVGHPQRMEFTVLGDVVNVAARLESANRQLGTTVLASDTIRDLTTKTHRHAPLGQFVLKGRAEPVEVFVPLGAANDREPGWFAALGRAQVAWAAGDFSIAATDYGALGAQPTPLADFFNHRARLARDYVAASPVGWRGAHVLDSK